MKLLFDQNLSPRLPRLLADIYADSVHVREVGLRDAGDNVIWEYAKSHGFAIVSEGFRLPATKFAVWQPAEIHLVARRQLSR